MTRPRTTQRDRVEQAIARGDSLDRIVESLHVEPRFVDEVLHRMDRAAAMEDDEPEPSPTRRLMIDGRPVSSYFGPADPFTIKELIDAICPPQSRRKKSAA